MPHRQPVRSVLLKYVYLQPESRILWKSVLTRYLMIAVEQRRCEDDRTLGEIFFFFTDEIADITFGESFQILMNAMIECVCAIFQPTEEQFEMFIEDVFGCLPDYIRNSLVKNYYDSLKFLSDYLYY